jgi:hypothetical protein
MAPPHLWDRRIHGELAGLGYQNGASGVGELPSQDTAADDHTSLPPAAATSEENSVQRVLGVGDETVERGRGVVHGLRRRLRYEEQRGGSPGPRARPFLRTYGSARRRSRT